jgi:hypothetical protein
MPRSATQSKKKSIYSVHPGVLMMQKWIGDLKQKTGRSLEEWMKHIKKDGPADEPARRDWLKAEYGLGTNIASSLAELSVGKGADIADPDLYLQQAERDVEKMFSGGKAALRPIYEGLVETRPEDRERREGVSVPNDRAALSEPCVRADQTGNANAH